MSECVERLSASPTIASVETRSLSVTVKLFPCNNTGFSHADCVIQKNTSSSGDNTAVDRSVTRLIRGCIIPVLRYVP
jgi:hypothetical protein